MIVTLSLIVLVALFAVATLTPINIGICALPAAFLVGVISKLSVKSVAALFPGDIFVLIVGVTLLFGIAKVNGTLDLVVDTSLRLVRNRRWAIVWLMFGLGAVLMCLGSILAVGMLSPIAMPIAARYRIKPVLMGMMLSHGALAAAMSPITVYGALTESLARQNGIHVSIGALFGVTFALNLLFAVVLFLVMGRDLLRRDDSARVARFLAEDAEGPAESQPQDGIGGPVPGGGATATTVRPSVRTEPLVHNRERIGVTPIRIVTLAGIIAVLVAIAAFGADPGVTAISVAVFVMLVAPRKHSPATKEIAWPAVLLACGMVTYMAVLQKNGTLGDLGRSVAHLGSPLIGALVLCVAIGISGALGSTIGTIGVAVPLAVPLIATGQVAGAALVIAIGYCSSTVEVSPFSTNGVIVLAQAQVPDKNVLLRRMIAYAGMVVILAPVAVFLTVILPSS